MRKQNKVVEEVKIEKGVSKEELFIQKQVAYIEGWYKGLWLGIPEDLRWIDGKKLEPAKIRFDANEKSLMQVKEIVESEIAQYDHAIKRSKDKIGSFKKYGNILSSLEDLNSKIDYILWKINDKFVDDGYGL